MPDSEIIFITPLPHSLVVNSNGTTGSTKGWHDRDQAQIHFNGFLLV